MRACIASATSVDGRLYFIHIKSPLTLTMTAQNSLKMVTMLVRAVLSTLSTEKRKNTQEAGDA